VKPHNKPIAEKCKLYIRKTGTLAEARALAKKDGFSANTSVWLAAFAEMVAEL